MAAAVEGKFQLQGGVRVEHATTRFHLNTLAATYDNPYNSIFPSGLVAFNFEFAYHFPSQGTWNVYAGAGPALNLLRFRGDTHAGGGLNLLMGVQHNRGLFAEFKVGTVDSPRVKFAVGYAVRWQ